MSKLIAAWLSLLLLVDFAVAQDSKPQNGDAAEAPPAREAKAKTEKIDLTKSEKVSAAEFKQHFARVGMAETMRHTEFLGVQDEMAIIRAHSMNPLTKGWSARLLTIKLADLDKELRAAVEKKQAALPALLANAENKTEANDALPAKPSHWGVRLCGWKDGDGKAVYMLVPEKYVGYDFDDLKNGKGDDAKYWEGDDQKRWKGLLYGESALLRALGEFPKGEHVRVEDFVTEYAVTDPKVLAQVKAVAKAAGLKLELDEQRAPPAADQQTPE